MYIEEDLVSQVDYIYFQLVLCRLVASAVVCKGCSSLLAAILKE